MFPKQRSSAHKLLDFCTFPIRALTLHGGNDVFGLSSLASERFYYVSQYVQGYCLDVGCGPHNRFVSEFRLGNGKGIDVFAYDGLTEDNIVHDMTKLPFPDEHFNSVTFIANLNHVPKYMRHKELSEAFRILMSGGNIVITMGRPFIEILVHKLVWFYDKYFQTSFDLDNKRGMHEEEAYYLTKDEIVQLMESAGFKNIERKLFWTQWGLNQLFIGKKI
jgi:hypothetical protein